jgi:Tol biopolymer transport system component
MKSLAGLFAAAILAASCAPTAPAATPTAAPSPMSAPTPTAPATATPAPTAGATTGAIPQVPGTYASAGPWIVYQAVFAGGVDIGLVRPDGSDAHQIPPAEWERWHPDWSPDGTRILYGRWVPATEEETVGVVNPDGSDDVVLLACEAPCLFTGAGWSREGRSLVFYRIEQRDAGEACLMGVHDLDTGNETIVTEHAGCASWDAPKDTSVDGQVLLFQRDAAGALALFTIDIDGSAEVQLTDWGVGARPDWSPDGEWIVFQGKENEPPSDPGVGVWRIRPDGSDLQQLTRPEAPTSDFYPRWLPDGSGVIFSTCLSPGVSSCEARVIDPDGSNDRLLFGDLGNQTVHVVWQPPTP